MCAATASCQIDMSNSGVHANQGQNGISGSNTKSLFSDCACATSSSQSRAKPSVLSFSSQTVTFIHCSLSDVYESLSLGTQSVLRDRGYVARCHEVSRR